MSKDSNDTDTKNIVNASLQYTATAYYTDYFINMHPSLFRSPALYLHRRQ